MYHWLSATFFTLVLVLSCLQLWLMIREDWDRIVGALRGIERRSAPGRRITTWTRNRARTWSIGRAMTGQAAPQIRAAR